MIKEYHLKIDRSIRYYTSGKLNEMTKGIWFVIHGYGQLANDFIKSFEALTEGNNFIIAPEAISRFYLKGGNGDIGASWMTKEDRQYEITDYVAYLDKLYLFILNSHKFFNVRINALGFSQGVATLSRWAILGTSKFDNIIFWAGEIANDLDYSKLKNIPISLVFGNKDQYFTGNSYKAQEAVLDKFRVKYRTHIFEGGHELKNELLSNLKFH